MKKIYDLRINSHGHAEPMLDGFFESACRLCLGAASKYNENEYILVDCPRAIYRVSKSDLEYPLKAKAINRFLERAKALSEI